MIEMPPNWLPGGLPNMARLNDWVFLVLNATEYATYKFRKIFQGNLIIDEASSIVPFLPCNDDALGSALVTSHAWQPSLK